MNNPSENAPVVSIIVPARNEEACLGTCLESLVAQTGISFEIIVVDDDSSDRTAEIARSFPGIDVIAAGPLPENWTGKNNAMAAGGRIAKGKWLLFTDADTVHKPGSLARAVAEAEQHGAALLSYSPEQEVHGFWEKAVMPVIFAELAATYPPGAVNDATSPIAAANGQYLMISRDAYDAVGGHAAVASDLLEDVAMARLVKSSGRRIFFRYGGDAVRTRMYRSWSQMKEGWTKNLALLFRHPGALAVQYLIESFLLVAVVTELIQILLFGPPQLPSLSVLLPHYPIPNRYLPLFEWWITGCLILLFVWLLARSIARVMKAHFPLRFSVTSLCGLPVFAFLLLRSTINRRNGEVRWKDRKYGSIRAKATAHQSPHTSSAGAEYR